jgi:hypothetical protein
MPEKFIAFSMPTIIRWRPAISTLIGRSRDWARIVVTPWSQENGKIMVAAFLVDTFCLGVKNAFCNEGLGRRQIEVNFCLDITGMRSPRESGSTMSRRSSTAR